MRVTRTSGRASTRTTVSAGSFVFAFVFAFTFTFAAARLGFATFFAGFLAIAFFFVEAVFLRADVFTFFFADFFAIVFSSGAKDYSRATLVP